MGEPATKAPNPRRMLRAQKLCAELGHDGDAVAALEHAIRMRSALRVIHTWAAFPPLNCEQVRKACADALAIGKP